MASIVQNIIGDNGLQLGNEEFVRKMPWGNNWQVLRIGLWCRVFGTYSSLHPTLLQIGVNSGDVNTFNSNNCAGYAGGVVGQPTGNGYLYLYEAANKRFLTANSIYPNSQCSKLGATATYSLSAGATNNAYIAAANSPTPSIVMCQITRPTSTSYSPTMYYTSAAQYTILQPATSYDFLRCMEDESYIGNFLTFGNTLTLTGLPTVMDTLSIFWNRNLPMLEIDNLVLVRLY